MAQYTRRQHRRQDADIFTRIWNSTLGLPEQLVRRIVRAAADPNVDLLSEEGLFDASLIPLFGAMDSHREDVTDKEWVDLVLPEGTPNNFGTQLGLALMTDPLSFLTAPLNALGKGGRAAGQLSRSMGAALPEGATVGQALETGQTLLQGTTLAKGARRKLRNNLNTLRGSGHNKDILLDEASRFANKRNLAIAVPFLSRLGSWAPKGLEGYKNWWQVLRMGTDRSLALAAPFGGAATRLPLVGRAFKMVGTAAADAAFGAKAGAKTAGRALFKTQLDRALEPGTFDPILDRVTPSIMRIRKHLNRLTKRGKFDDLGQTFDERLGKQSELRKKLLGLEAEENADIIKALEERGAAKGKDPLGEAHLTLAADKTQLGRAKAKLANAKSRAKRLARKRNAADKAKYKKHKAAAARWEQLVKKKQAEVSEFSALLNPKQRQKVKAGVRRKISTAAKESHAKAFLRSLGMKTKRLSGEELQDEASRVWHSITGGEAGPLPIRGSELQAGVQKFQGDMTDSLTELFEGRTRMARTQAKELKQEALKRGGISRAFFKVFSEAEKLRTRTFLSGIQSKELIKQENLLWNSMARSTEAVQENYLALIARIPDAAREMGVSPDDFRSIMRNTLESSSFSKEITILTDLAHSSPEKFHASMEDFVTRAVSATDSLKTILRVRGGAEARQAGERVGELTRGVLDEGVTRAEFLEKLSDSVVPSRWKEYEWGAHPSHPTMFRARTGSASGLRLIHVSDTGLKGLMREGTRKEKTAAAKVLDLRAQGRSEWVKPEKVPAEQLPVPPRTPERIDSVDNLGEADELGEYTYVLAQLLSDTAELKRLKGAPPVVLIDRVNSNLARASGLLEDTVRAGMGETGQFILDETRRIQREIVVGAYNAGALSAGSPIAYVPRVFSAERAKEVQEILSDIPADILQAAAPSYGSTIHRSMGALTIEELEDLTIALRRREPEKAAELEELLSATGVNIKRYTDDPFEAIFTRYAQHGSHNTTKDFVNSIVKDGNTGLIGGRVVGVVSETGVNLDLAEIKRIRARSGDDAVVIEPISEEVLDEIRGVVIRNDATGKDHFISATSLDDDSVLFALGARGDNAGDAFANRTARGDLFRKGGVYRQSSALSRKEILDLAGQNVLFGNAMSTLGIGGALSKQYQVAPALIQGYDEIHGLMRRLQTVWRLPFHISNLASGFFQARMNGVSMGDAGHGMMDALRLLWRQKDFVKRYDRYAKTFGRGTGVIPMLSTTRRAGIDGVKMLAGAEDYVFRIGDQDINISELLQKMVDNNLFGSFVSEGLRGSDSVTRTLERIRDMAEAGGVKGTYLRVTDKATKIGESSEILVRLAGVMSNLRAGMHMDDAITMTKNAMVDYAKVTPIEKTWLKRVFSYYTFPRHYIPFAWKRFGEDPQIASKLAHTVKSALGNGLLVDEGGNVEVRLDDWRVNVQRMDANMDALMSGAAIVNFLMPETQGKSPSIEGAPASPAFLEAGPLATPIMHALLGSDREVGDKSFVGEVASAVPQIRYFMDPLWNKPEINYSPLELAAATLLPTRKVKEKHEQRVLVARFKDMERFIRRELVHANARGDDDAVQLLQEDLQQAGAALRASVERLEK